MNKRDLPLSLLVKLKEVKDQLKDSVKSHEFLKIEEDSLIRLLIVDANIESSFFFELQDAFLEANSTAIFSIEFKPKNTSSTDSQNINSKYGDVYLYFLNWLEIITGYNDTILTSEEEILKANQERFLKDFEVVDEDSENSSFNLEQQLFLDGYLSKTIEILDSFKPDMSDTEIVEIEELKGDAANIRKHLTKDTKKTIIDKLTRFWAKAQIVGLDVIKEVFVKYLTELTVKLITGT